MVLAAGGAWLARAPVGAQVEYTVAPAEAWRVEYAAPTVVRQVEYAAPAVVQQGGYVVPAAVQQAEYVAPAAVRQAGYVAPAAVRQAGYVAPAAVRRAGYAARAAALLVAFAGLMAAQIYGHLPSGSREVHWHGNNYWCFGFSYYQPCWYGGEVYYYSVPAPVGVYVDTLPPEADTVVYNNQTYYYSDGSYLMPKDSGYEVVDKPAGLDQAPDPMALLRQMTDCLGQMQRFSVVADETTDEILESGEKVQLSSRRTVYVRRPMRWPSTTGPTRAVGACCSMRVR